MVQWLRFTRARVLILGDSSFSLSAALVRRGLTFSLSKDPTSETRPPYRLYTKALSELVDEHHYSCTITPEP